MPKTKDAPPKTGGPGSAIAPDVLYPLPEFMRLTGWGRHAMRAARNRGLRVRYTGNRGFVLGGDFIAYVRDVG